MAHEESGAPGAYETEVISPLGLSSRRHDTKCIAKAEKAETLTHTESTPELKTHPRLTDSG